MDLSTCLPTPTPWFCTALIVDYIARPDIGDVPDRGVNFKLLEGGDFHCQTEHLKRFLGVGGDCEILHLPVEKVPTGRWRP